MNYTVPTGARESRASSENGRERKGALRAAIFIATCWWLVAANAAAQTPSFRLPGSFPVGGTPFDLLIRDLNGDDHLDFVSTNFNGGTISVLLGTGTGDFTALEDIPASAAPIKVIAIHADADQNIDLVISEGESDFIYLLRGNGDGTFGEQESIASGHDPYALATADMNHDEIPDVVQSLATESGGRVNVLLGDGLGNFALTEENGRRLNAPSYGVVLGDFDEDGDLDAASTTIGRPSNCLSNNCGTLSITLGDGTGQLDRPFDFATGPSPFAIAVADLDHDDHLDIITGDSGDDALSVFKGSGKVPVTPEDPPFFERVAVVPVGVTPGSIVLADFNGDGWLEAVVGNVRSGDISVLPGLPGGGFGPARHFVSGIVLNSAGAGDFNEDTHVDLLGLNQGDVDPTASLLLARADGGYNAVQTLMPTVEQAGIAAGDIRGNGAPVVVLTVTAASEARILTPEGVQRFSEPLDLSLPFRPTLATLRDLDGDGRADLVAMSNAAKMGVALADGEGSFAEAVSFDLAGPPSGVAMADVDGDSHLDAVLPIGAPAGVAILYGNGDGTLAAPVSMALGGRPGGIAVGDFDGNGIEDVAVGNAQENAVSLILGASDRNLGGQSVPLTSAPGNLACADVDADGRDDLVISSGNSLRFLYGNEGGGFTAAGQLSIGKPVSGLVARDVTGDLLPDVVATVQGTNDLAIAANRGDRSFAQPEIILLGLRPGAIAVADFDVDGRYDIGVSGAYGWALTNDAEARVTRGDGNDDGIFSIADLTAVRAARARGARVEDILRLPDAGRPNAGVDANGDGRVDLADERLSIAKLFD
jgi:hypothetical protein